MHQSSLFADKNSAARPRYAKILRVLIVLALLCATGTTIAANSGMRTTDFFELVRTRRSIRAYQPREVDPATIQKILEAAKCAPSAGNLQAYEVVVVRDPERRARLARAALGQAFIAEASVALIFVTDPQRSAAKYGQRGAELYSIQDAAIAATYAQLAAHALGLGSVWVGAFRDSEVLAAVGGSEPQRAVSLLVLGYPRESPSATPRRPLSDLARKETLSSPWRPAR